MDKNKSRRIIIIVLVIAGILGLASIAIAYYYFQIRDVTPEEASAAQGCGCYYIQGNDKNICSTANPRNALEFKAGFVQDNGSCSVTCDSRFADDTANESESVVGCQMQTFPINPGCIDVSIENDQGKRLAGTVDTVSAKKVRATFNIPQSLSSTDAEFYESFSFLINGERTEIDVIDAVKRGSGTDTEYTVSMDLPSYADSDKLIVQAFAKSVVSDEVTSPACLRELTVTQQQAPSCSALDITLEKDGTGTTRVKEMTIDTSGLNDVDTLEARLTVGSGNTVLTTKDISSKYLSGTILLDEAHLYNSANFTEGQSLSILDSETSKIDVSAVLIVNGQEILSEACVTSERIESSSPDEEENPSQPNGGEDDDDEDDDTDPEQQPGEGTTSNFSVAKNASRQCVARTSPQNVLTYTVTVSNDDTDTEKITSIVDKLPLGFKYVSSSSSINGISVLDANFVQVATVGQAQQITWTTADGWPLTAGQKMTVTYRAEVEANALNGKALNEVVVIPANTPATPSSVRTEVEVTVSQSCTAPETSVFDSTLARITAGVLVVAFGVAFYASSTGYSLSSKLAGSPITQGLYKAAQMTGWRVTNPRKFFEEKSISRIERKRKANRS